MTNTIIHQITLPNGIRVVLEPIDYVASVAVGVWIDAGSRYEAIDEQGISHVCEHMFFKGTDTRTAKQIPEEIESLGGYINAFTDKETTCFYIRSLAEHLYESLDVLLDVLTNPKLDQKDLDFEKLVILEEIKRRDDSPEDLVHEVFLQQFWQDHPLGRSILGTKEAVFNMTSEKLRNYVGKHYTGDSIVVAAAGMIEPEKFFAFISEKLGGIKPLGIPKNRCAPEPFYTKHLVADDTEQVHFCIGSKGYSQHHEDKYVLGLIDTILGGGMSSRLFQEIREKRGLAYSIGSYSSAYNEGGSFTIYGGTGLPSFDKAVEVTIDELEKLRNKPVPIEELSKSKNHVRGSIVLGMEGMNQRMMRLGRNIQYFDRVLDVDEVLAEIEKVTQDDIMRVSNDLFKTEELTMVAIGPFDEGE